MKLRRTVLLAVFAAALSSCAAEDVQYLIRAAYEEARILSRREAIEDVLSGEDVDRETREKLELCLAARSFAEQRLALDVGGSYSSIASVDQDQIVHVVSAAYRDKLERYTWWFPIVGTVPYRGYFRRESAVNLAETLEKEGYDTYVRRALAFSTLGYFDDPLLSHLLRRSKQELVETILHELLHTTVYFSGHAAFNESFANFVGHRGAIAFFEERGASELAGDAERRWQDALQFGRLLSKVLDELETAYAAGIDEEGRARLFASARASYAELSWNTNEYERFATGTLNNAVLLARQVYFDRLRLFENVFQRFDGDLPRTIEWVVQAARSGDEPYSAIEGALTSSP